MQEKTWKQIFKRLKCEIFHVGHDFRVGICVKRHLKFKRCVRCGYQVLNKKQLVNKTKKMRKNNQRVKFY